MVFGLCLKQFYSLHNICKFAQNEAGFFYFYFFLIWVLARKLLEERIELASRGGFYYADC